MQLPALAPGKRFTLPRPFGSADALLLARFAQDQKSQGRPTAVITAEPADTQRLESELSFFAPDQAYDLWILAPVLTALVRRRITARRAKPPTDAGGR